MFSPLQFDGLADSIEPTPRSIAVPECLGQIVKVDELPITVDPGRDDSESVKTRISFVVVFGYRKVNQLAS